MARERAEDARSPGSPIEPEPIPDDRLRLLFTCCDPALTPESQATLTLKLVGGLSAGEIARAFLVGEPTISQRIVRAKKTLRERNVPYEVPEPAELPARLAAVLSVLYSVFNESYAAREGPHLTRVALGDEAIRLATTLAELMPAEPEVLGLLALMELQRARDAARVDTAGEMVLLADQDRARWDPSWIARGQRHLASAQAIGRPGGYQVQAAIAECHAAAPTWDATEWTKIAALYAELQALEPSPIVALNRAVAVSMVDGPAAGLALMDALRDVTALQRYHYLPAARADLLRRLTRWSDAAAEYRRALALTRNRREEAFLRRRLAECEEAAG